MRSKNLKLLQVPTASSDLPLNLKVFSEKNGRIIEGVITSGEEWFPIVDGVPCFLRGVLRPDFSDFAKKHGLVEAKIAIGKQTMGEDQALTNETFSDKWRKFKTYGLEESHQEFLRDWYCGKFGLPDVDALKFFYSDFENVLEVGPGSGFNTKFIGENCSGKVFALDVSDAAFTTYENTADLSNVTVVQADVMDPPFAEGTFDFAMADGVLHHTPDTRLAVESLFKMVKPGGKMFFYVYKKMGEARQFCDEYIRSKFMPLSPDDCYTACEGITELGHELSKLNAKITLTKGIPELGIPAGQHDVQRLIYYNFMKCFWNDAFDQETNNMVNFDWYHPHNAWQHTEDEVAGWMRDLGVTDFVFNDANPNGISCMVTKP
ncbi:class I SAM-dependent methyltransferase [Alphaproteobacteria bacterium]|nr:class I SAM-dependent methyltransferase [Alphaproteobacteria bacterium]